MSVWKRLQRVGKRASKFQFTASYQELTVEVTKKWYVDCELLSLDKSKSSRTECQMSGFISV